MCRKLICLISFVAVLIMAHNVSAGLVGHWKFDEGSGATASDSSGRGNHGTITNARWDAGFISGALNFDAVGYVSIPPASWSSIQNQVTIAFWAYGNPPSQPQANFIFGAFQDPAVNDARVASAHVPWSNGTVYFDTGGTAPASGYDRINKAATPQEYEGAWQHWAFTKNAVTGEQKIYHNGSLWHSGTGLTRTMKGVTAFTIGCKPSIENFYAGMIDDFRLYDMALAEAEIKIVATPPMAHKPSPADGALLTETWASLGWSAGVDAVSHDVYIGENAENVATGTAETFRGNQVATFFLLGLGMPGDPYPAGLVPGTTYYWRIDEVEANGTTKYQGAVWSFFIPPKKAYNPGPPDGAKYVDTGASLKWTAGLGAKLHYVYFGASFNAVNNATVGAPLGTTSFTPPGPLEKGKTYYWRIDEFDAAATHKGDVWSFTTLPNIPIADPNLAGWWTLDEGEGTTAVDWSGRGKHGTFQGDPRWVDGLDGGALEFDGDDYVDTGNTQNLAKWTIACWVISPAAPANASPSGPLHREKNYQFDWNHTDAVFRGAVAMEIGGTWHAASYMPVAANTWYHLAATFDGTALRAYRDGVLITTNTAASGVPTAETGTLKLGRHATAAQFFTGTVDDARVYNKALSAAEIQAVMRGNLTRAWKPSPVNGSTSDVVRAASLNWSRGDKASQHAVYFGTDRNAVANADTSDTTGVYRGLQGGTSYVPPEIAWAGGLYYWRIDEHNTDGTITKGTTWSFSVADYLLVDDFESYNDIPAGQAGSNLVYLAWLDGFGTTTNGSTMGYPTGSSLETTRVHGGGKAVPLIYNNSTASFSEVERTFAAQNWTSHGIQTLSLWFRGDAANVPGQLYVKINGVKVPYDGDASNLKREAWQTWNIPLATAGVNLQSVTRLAIGIETRGATGTLLLDDIRLYALPRELITPVQPNAASLIGRWTFDGNTQDSSGLGNHGTPGGGPTFGAGIVGSGAINLSGSSYVAIDGVVNDITSTDLTLSAWIKTTQTTEGDIFSCNNSASTHYLVFGVRNGNLFMEDNVATEFSAVNDDQWHFIAYVRNGSTGYIYLDGIQIGTDPTSFSLASVTRWSIGHEWDDSTPSDFYVGAVDDARFYNYPLSEAEVAGLAGMTLPFDKPS